MQRMLRSPAVRWMLMLLLLAGAYMSLHQTAFACSCAGPRSVGEELTYASAVFAGEVVQMQGGMLGGTADTVTFQVSEVWKGPVENRITLRMSIGTCNYPFSSGQEYLVYAADSGSDLSATICSRTAPLSQAAQDLAYLGPGQQPEPEPVSPVLSTGLLLLIGATVIAMLAVIGVGMWSALRHRRRRSGS